MRTAKFVEEITVNDPDYNSEVKLSIYKHDNGGMFAIDSSFLDSYFTDDTYPIIRDPFERKGDLMLVEDNQLTSFIGNVDLEQ